MSYEYAIAALVSTMVAVIVTNNFYGHSFFDKHWNRGALIYHRVEET